MEQVIKVAAIAWNGEFGQIEVCSCPKEGILIEPMMSDRKLEASREGSK